MSDTPPTRDSLLTRHTLLERLQQGGDQCGWGEFFEIYRRLIYNVARKSGLDHEAAEDVVQESLLSVTQSLPDFDPDPARGRFRGWLLRIVRCRIIDHQRKNGRWQRQTRPLEDSGEDGQVPAELERLWQSEWEESLMAAALRLVQVKVSARQFMIFDMAVIRQTPAGQITRALGVNLTQVYLARHRVGRLLRQEIARLRGRDE